jgi:hypothetical protein
LQGLAGARPVITDSYFSPPGAFDAVDLVARALSDFWVL